MANKQKKLKQLSDRITVTLGKNQREQLQRLAERNNTTLAFVLRYIVKEFLERMSDPQLQFDFRLPSNDRE